MLKYSIYIVDDEETIRNSVSLAMEDKHEIRAFSNAVDAIDAIRKSPPDLVLLDIGMPEMNGIEALRRIREHDPEILVIMITAFEDVDSVLAAMKGGAHDYIVKPLHMDNLEVTVGNALETIRLRKEVRLLHKQYLEEHMPCFIAESNAIQSIMEFVRTVAKSPDTPILIQGETGTGKELIAGAIHYHSPNFKGPLVTVNCAAIPKDLIESELFGYEKGAFSGASPEGKRGFVEAAADGTLFLDEVGDLSLEAQAKLLRFLENGEYTRVGSTKIRRARARVVSATNKDLKSMMDDGKFRKDLFFRLGVINVAVPALKERKGDIIPLAKYFLLMYGKKFDKEFTGFSGDAEEALLSRNWSGNVRQLKNIIEKAALTADGPVIELNNLDMTGRLTPTVSESAAGQANIPKDGIDLGSILDSLEKSYISEALRLAGNNETKAAGLLGMNHHTFRYRKKKLGL